MLIKEMAAPAKRIFFNNGVRVKQQDVFSFRYLNGLIVCFGKPNIELVLNQYYLRKFFFNPKNDTVDTHLPPMQADKELNLKKHYDF